MLKDVPEQDVPVFSFVGTFYRFSKFQIRLEESNHNDFLTALLCVACSLLYKLLIAHSSLNRRKLNMLTNLIKLGGSAMLMKEIADRVTSAGIYRERTLQRKKRSMMAVGLAIGGVVGVAAGILYAPRPGRETREELSRKSRDAWHKLSEDVSHTGHYLASRAEETGAKVRSEAEKQAEAAKDTAKETKEALEKQRQRAEGKYT